MQKIRHGSNTTKAVHGQKLNLNLSTFWLNYVINKLKEKLYEFLTVIISYVEERVKSALLRFGFFGVLNDISYTYKFGCTATKDVVYIEKKFVTYC